MTEIENPRDFAKRLRAAGHDERLSTGALYLEAAEMIEQLYGEACRWRFLRDHVTGVVEVTAEVFEAAKLNAMGDPIPEGGCGCRDNGIPVMRANCRLHGATEVAP